MKLFYYIDLGETLVIYLVMTLLINLFNFVYNLDNILIDYIIKKLKGRILNEI